MHAWLYMQYTITPWKNMGIGLFGSSCHASRWASVFVLVVLLLNREKVSVGHTGGKIVVS